MPARLEAEIGSAFEQLCGGLEGDPSFAVRSSATAEDLPDASFAGQQETFLNIHGIDNLLSAVKHVFASLYNDRAISYRVHKGFIHADVALSAGVQRMVRSDLGASGVMFSLDTESGFDQVVFITSSYGLGRDRGARRGQPRRVLRLQAGTGGGAARHPAPHPGLEADQDGVLGAARGRALDAHAGRAGSRAAAAFPSATPRSRSWLATRSSSRSTTAGPMDIEWGRDGDDGKLYILQARPETVKANAKHDTQKRFRLKQRSEVLASGRAIGNRVGRGAGAAGGGRERDGARASPATCWSPT